MTSCDALIPGGFIIVARKLLESGIMEKPPLYTKLWVWMLMKASWKDHGNLKRGQFRTSIDAMREAMTFKIGYRTLKPSRREIRDVYEALTKGTMIVITKVTHGMIITILNYDYYQNPKNYEGHSERHNEGPDRGTIKRIKGNKGKNIADPRISVLTSFFYDECFTSRGFKPSIDGGDGKTVKEALKSMTEDEIKQAITFYLKSQKADDCGITLKAILSTHSLNLWKAGKGSNDDWRDKYPKL